MKQNITSTNAVQFVHGGKRQLAGAGNHRRMKNAEAGK